MELYILGSGTCIPNLERHPPGILIKTEQEDILIDSGSGTLRQLLKIGVDYRQLKHLMYTHSHPDHTAELIPILLALYVSTQDVRKDDLLIYGPPGFSEFFQNLAAAYGAWVLQHNLEIQVRELLQNQVQIAGCTVTTAPMKHARHSIGYRFDSADNKCITYSGDTDYCREIIELARESDVLILECSFPDDQKMNGHLTPTSAATIAAEANCKHLVLTHFYPACDKIDILPICQKIYSGKISLAADLMHIKL